MYWVYSYTVQYTCCVYNYSTHVHVHRSCVILDSTHVICTCAICTHVHTRTHWSHTHSGADPGILVTGGSVSQLNHTHFSFLASCDKGLILYSPSHLFSLNSLLLAKVTTVVDYIGTLGYPTLLAEMTACRNKSVAFGTTLVDSCRGVYNTGNCAGTAVYTNPKHR